MLDRKRKTRNDNIVDKMTKFMHENRTSILEKARVVRTVCHYLGQGNPVDYYHQDGKRTNFLILSAKYGLGDLMRVLVFAGGDVNVRDRVGYTVMHHVCKSNDFETLRYVLGCQTYNHLHES